MAILRLTAVCSKIFESTEGLHLIMKYTLSTDIGKENWRRVKEYKGCPDIEIRVFEELLIVRGSVFVVYKSNVVSKFAEMH